MTTPVDSVYRERMHLVAMLAATFPSYINREDEDWPVVLIDIPTGQVSWHFSKDDWDLFDDIPMSKEIVWDGHDTEEKYRRLDHFTNLLVRMFKIVSD
jgi:hypothetical protein